MNNLIQALMAITAEQKLQDFLEYTTTTIRFSQLKIKFCNKYLIYFYHLVVIVSQNIIFISHLFLLIHNIQNKNYKLSNYQHPAQ